MMYTPTPFRGKIKQVLYGCVPQGLQMSTLFQKGFATEVNVMYLV